MPIERVNLEAILDLRRDVLRPGQPRDAAGFIGDDHGDTHHFAAFDGDRVIACVSLMPSTFDEQPAWQLRGMAVAPDAQRRGVGGDLLRHLEQHLPDPPTLWCNAREPAVPFYEKHGWTVVSDSFDLPGVGPHRRMARRR